MKVDQNPRFPADSGSLIRKLTDLFRDYGRQVNDFSEGKIAAATNATTAAPTTGTYKQGDFVRKSAPVEAGTALTKYVIVGWVCTVSGTPGTWVECRYLTGN
jgi:hypothetical protein